ncbi:MAG: PEP-CTERM sorting domain-containing protein [Colwellia sp.]
MKKLIVIVCVFLMSFTSNATLLSVNFDDVDYQVGDVISADIIISEIESDSFNFTKLVANFNFNVLFDESILEFSNVIFGDKLDVDPDPFWASEQTSNLISAGNIKLQEVAQAFDFDLFDAQGGLSQFILATVNFNVLASGSGTIELINVVIGDEMGISFTDITAGKQSFTTVNNVDVPEPATLWLFMSAMMFFLRKKV